MLNQLVESQSNQKENRLGFFLTTFFLTIGLFFSAVLWSLFAKDLGMGTDALELSTLVAPIQASENAPPELSQKQEKIERNAAEKRSLPTRQDNILRIEESPIPPVGISVTPNTQKSRPNGSFLISNKIDDDEFQGARSFNPGAGSDGGGLDIRNSQPTPVEETSKIEPPPAMKKTPNELAQKTKPLYKSGGVVNGQAKFLPKPVYSTAAKAVRASGTVNVQVLIDETGNVVSANAVNGHPLLRVEAEKAARNAKFNPTLLTDQPVKVSGVIIYKFEM